MRANFRATPARQLSARFVFGGIVLFGGCVATLIDLIIAQIATPLVHAPVSYPSFSWLPILSGCLFGVLGGYACFLLLDRLVVRPKITFLFVASGVLLVSYGLPILPIINPLPRFAGVNWGIALTLMGMHTLTAMVIVSSILLGESWSRQRRQVDRQQYIAASNAEK